MMKKGVMGLRSATQYEIECIISELENEWNKVVHITRDSLGRLLPFNGVLYINCEPKKSKRRRRL